MNNVDNKLRSRFSALSVNSLITQVITLNLMDALLTLYATLHGVSEANPIMDYLLDAGPIHFIIAKVLIVTVSVMALNRLCHDSGRRTYIFVVAMYWFVTFWHVFGLLNLYALAEGG